MDMITQAMMMSSDEATPPTLLTYNGVVTGTTANTATLNFGTESPDRVVVVALTTSNGANTTLSNVVIAGVTATVEQQVSADFMAFVIAWAVIPTGTSGTVTWSDSGGPDRFNISAYSLYNYKSSDSIFSIRTSGSDPSSINNLSIPYGSVGFALYVTFTGTTDVIFSNNLTLTYNNAPQGRMSSAIIKIGSYGLQSFTGDFVGTPSRLNSTHFVVVVWR